MKDAETIKRELAMPFAPQDLEWRLQQAFEDKMGGLAVPYVTNRAIQDRLDDVVGVDNWHNDYKPWHGNGKKESQVCGISIYFEGRGWVTKWDGAEDTDVEPIKGGLSDSMKRAAVHWGIGRVLYKMDAVWVDIKKRGKSWVIKSENRPKLDKAYMDLLNRLGLEPAQPGGLQSQLTPTPDESAQQDTAPTRQPQGGAPTQKPAGIAPQQPAQPPAEGGKVTNFPTPQRPRWQYKVESATVQPGMSRECMSLVLIGADGKKTRAFYPTVTEDLAQGAELYDATLELKKQGTVAFYMLKTYKVVPPDEAAA